MYVYNGCICNRKSSQEAVFHSNIIPSIVAAFSVGVLLALPATDATAAVLAVVLCTAVVAASGACGTSTAGHRAAVKCTPAAPHCAALLLSSVYSN
jgi:hypothetical protein